MERFDRIIMIALIILISIVSWIFNIYTSHEWNLTGKYQQYYDNYAVDLCNENNIISVNKSWIVVGSYYGLKYFYVKRGSKQCYDRNKTITVATMCDINLIHEARQIALNYNYGPLSVALYIDQYVSSFMEDPNTKHLLLKTIQSHFYNLSNVYDIYIGLLFINKRSTYYQSKHFTDKTSMIWKLPYNSLRNMAETQVRTEWLFLVDIDFWYYSDTFNNLEKHFFDTIQGINTEKTVFIVPPFEEYKHPNITMNLSSITKEHLLYYVSNKYVLPFGNKTFWGNFVCTRFDKWFVTTSNYLLNNCTHITYEPWYIMKTKVSREKKYRWRNEYIGRGHNKVSRMVTLRHYCFDLLVIHNMFIIHSAVPHFVKNKKKTTQKDFGGWQRKNRVRFSRDIDWYKRDNNSCLPNKTASQVKKRNAFNTVSMSFNKKLKFHTKTVQKPKEKPNLSSMIKNPFKSFKIKRKKIKTNSFGKSWKS